MATAIQIILVLLVLFNFFVLFMCAKRWRLVHVFATFLVFAAAIFFMFLATMSLKTNLAWKKAVQEREKEVVEVQKQEVALKFGELETKTENPETTIIGVKAAVEREQYDRGRIWPNCVARADATSITVTTFTPDAAAAPDAPIRANKMVEKMILFAFKEKELNPGDGYKVPYDYLGEFKATAVTDTTVTLEPTLPLDDSQKGAINAGDATWVLYEIMPVDSHESFAGLSRAELQAKLGTDEKRVLDEYAYDLMPINEIQKLDSDFAASLDDRPEHVWFKVKFLKAHSIDVDSTDAPAADKTLFDSSGRALPLSLRQGDNNGTMAAGKTDFEIGWFAIFDRDSANQLLGDGIVEKVEEVYVRPLQNYDHHFHEIDKRFKQNAERIAVVKVDTANVEASNVSAKKQADYRLKERDSLRGDLQGLQYELGEATAYRVKLETDLAKLRAELSDLYRVNNALVAELAAYQKRIAEELDKPASQPDLEPISISTSTRD